MNSKIVKKRVLAPDVIRFELEAPVIAAKHKAGQFVIILHSENGERIPLTIADSDPKTGTISIISQSVGKSTKELAKFEPGDVLLDIAGPLGSPTHIDRFGTVVCIGGGIGAAPLYPITKALRHAGNRIITILGARSRNMFILKEEMNAMSDQLILTTDDGSEGRKGFVTDALTQLIENGTRIDLVIAIGPSIMMKMVAEKTRPGNIPTIASLNTIMVDGTGMCGGCRVTVGGETKFVCVDGPEFDAHQVDWDEMLNRLQTYHEHECQALRQIERAENY